MKPEFQEQMIPRARAAPGRKQRGEAEEEARFAALQEWLRAHWLGAALAKRLAAVAGDRIESGPVSGAEAPAVRVSAPCGWVDEWERMSHWRAEDATVRV